MRHSISPCPGMNHGLWEEEPSVKSQISRLHAIAPLGCELVFLNHSAVILAVAPLPSMDRGLPANRHTVISKSCPFKPTAPITSLRFIPNLTHPHVSSSIVFLPLHTFQYTGHSAFAFWSVLWTELFPVPTISDIDTLIAGQGMRRMACAGAILCFHSSCISACMTSKELWGR